MPSRRRRPLFVPRQPNSPAPAPTPPIVGPHLRIFSLVPRYFSSGIAQTLSSSLGFVAMRGWFLFNVLYRLYKKTIIIPEASSLSTVARSFFFLSNPEVPSVSLTNEMSQRHTGLVLLLSIPVPSPAPSQVPPGTLAALAPKEKQRKKSRLLRTPDTQK